MLPSDRDVVYTGSVSVRVTDIRRATDRVESLALVPNGDLQYVAEPLAREKLTRLGEAA